MLLDGDEATRGGSSTRPRSWWSTPAATASTGCATTPRCSSGSPARPWPSCPPSSATAWSTTRGRRCVAGAPRRPTPSSSWPPASPTSPTCAVWQTLAHRPRAGATGFVDGEPRERFRAFVRAPRRARAGRARLGGRRRTRTTSPASCAARSIRALARPRQRRRRPGQGPRSSTSRPLADAASVDPDVAAAAVAWWPPSATTPTTTRFVERFRQRRHAPGAAPLPLRPGRLPRRGADGSAPLELAFCRRRAHAERPVRCSAAAIANRDHGALAWRVRAGALGRGQRPLPHQLDRPHGRRRQDADQARASRPTSPASSPSTPSRRRAKTLEQILERQRVNVALRQREAAGSPPTSPEHLVAARQASWACGSSPSSRPPSSSTGGAWPAAAAAVAVGGRRRWCRARGRRAAVARDGLEPGRTLPVILDGVGGGVGHDAHASGRPGAGPRRHAERLPHRRVGLGRLPRCRSPHQLPRCHSVLCRGCRARGDPGLGRRPPGGEGRPLQTRAPAEYAYLACMARGSRHPWW